MKKFYSFVCLVTVLTIICCYFTGCSDDAISAMTTNGKTAVDITGTVNANVELTESESVIGSIDNNITDYNYCWLCWPDGTVIIGELVSWVVVSENLIQVTVTDTRKAGTGGHLWNDGETCTILLSPDRVVLCKYEED